MSDNIKVDAVRYFMVIAVLSILIGCKGKETPPPENSSANRVKSSLAASADQKSGKGAAVKPAVSSEKKIDEMPAGMEKLRASQRKFVAERLEVLQKQLMKDSEAVGKAEKSARIADPKLGKLYNDLIAAKIAYNNALKANEIYAAAQKANIETFKQYQLMVERSKTLNKEKSNAK